MRHPKEFQLDNAFEDSAKASGWLLSQADYTVDLTLSESKSQQNTRWSKASWHAEKFMNQPLF